MRIALVLSALLFVSLTNAEESRMSVAQKAAEMIARFEQGKLRPGFDAGGVRADKSTSGMPVIGSGPTVMIDPTNVEEHVGVVALNGEDLAALGAGIFPSAFALLDHKTTYMRIIGSSALNSISGKKALWYVLQPPWDSNGDQTDWALEAKSEWIEWYATRLTSELEWTRKQAQASAGKPAPRTEPNDDPFAPKAATNELALEYDRGLQSPIPEEFASNKGVSIRVDSPDKDGFVFMLLNNTENPLYYYGTGITSPWFRLQIPWKRGEVRETELGRWCGTGLYLPMILPKHCTRFKVSSKEPSYRVGLDYWSDDRIQDEKKMTVWSEVVNKNRGKGAAPGQPATVPASK